MGSLGQVRIGHKAPDFCCDAVIKGKIEEVSLGDYCASKKGEKGQWLILLFIPAAFSFVCPTEVLAFQNCLDEFRDRNCQVVFISVDTKYALWHWQLVPRQYGGLGQIDIPLLSDASHKMCREYGVLIEEQGVSLRAMFILDDKAVVQHATLNNVTVGRSVLEALRLLEAFQAVDKHGVLCPIDWRPTPARESANTVPNTITESYDERLAQLQKEFGDTPVTDLDVKHGTSSRSHSEIRQSRTGQDSQSIGSNSTSSTKSAGSTTPKDPNLGEHGDLAERPPLAVNPPHVEALPRVTLEVPQRTSSAPASTATTPLPSPTPTKTHRPALKKGSPNTPRNSRDQTSLDAPPPNVYKSLSLIPNNHMHTPKSPLRRHNSHNTYESHRGSLVVLEFADPTSSNQSSHGHPPSSPDYITTSAHTSSHSRKHGSSPSSPMNSLGRYMTESAPAHLYMNGAVAGVTPNTSPRSAGGSHSRGGVTANGNGTVQSQTRLQMTFEAIKKMSSGLGSPKFEFGVGGGKKVGSSSTLGKGSDKEELGYFDVVTEGVSA